MRRWRPSGRIAAGLGLIAGAYAFAASAVGFFDAWPMWVACWVFMIACGFAFGRALGRYQLAVQMEAAGELALLVEAVLDAQKRPPAEAEGRN